MNACRHEPICTGTADGQWHWECQWSDCDWQCRTSLPEVMVVELMPVNPLLYADDIPYLPPTLERRVRA